MLFNYKLLMAMFMLPLAITQVAIMAKKAMWTISALAICVIDGVILGVQLKSKKKLAQWR